MERWSSVLKIPLIATSSNYYRVAASLCLSEVPSANAVFFHGDRVRDTGNTVIERLYDLRKVAEVIVSKFGNSVNAWVVEASVFNGPFAVYKDFVPTVNRYGEPTTSYSPVGLPASSSIVSLLSSFLQEAESLVLKEGKDVCLRSSLAHCPRTILLGFSKGGVVMNQFLSEMSSLETNSSSEDEEIGIIPASKESFLKSVSEVHYVDVGLNSSGAYITDQNVVQRISQRLAGGGSSVSVFVHGTPRQWRDEQRGWIVKEKDELVRLLKSEGENSGGKLQVHERFYFADRVPDLQMHFEIIDVMDVSSA
ncbi:BnaA04g25910D [Brassica napus]|uniref:BnaA04g25910D protein n=1 Tax=Brassica napus TaxID=3708 RepID=A0A078HJL0_BRANA|nr:mitochondrial protein C2orf69 homolog [Brassica napus]CDY37013.1 BnaA04g25910D [Brassica napus]